MDGAVEEEEAGVEEGEATGGEGAAVGEGATPCRAPGPGSASRVSAVEVAGGEEEGDAGKRTTGCVASHSDVYSRCIKTMFV